MCLWRGGPQRVQGRYGAQHVAQLQGAKDGNAACAAQEFSSGRHRNQTRKCHAPRRRQYSASGGMAMDVQNISSTCRIVCAVP